MSMKDQYDHVINSHHDYRGFGAPLADYVVDQALELPFSSPVNYVQICVDGQEVLWHELPIGHGFSRPCNYVELPDGNELYEIREIPHGSLTQEFYKSKISDNWEKLMIHLPPCAASAGLSMGSMQTTRTACDHPELFSEVGIFSGFIRDRLEGNPEWDEIDRKPCAQSHLKAMDDPAFNGYFHTFFRCIGDEDGFLPVFLEEDEIIQEKGVREIRKIYPGGHDWNVWRPCFADFAQMIFR